MNSFVRFDDLLIERIFTPISEWLFSQFGISNFYLAKLLCKLLFMLDFVDIYIRLNQQDYSTAVLDFVLLGLFSGIFWRILSESRRHTPGTASVFRFNYVGRFAVLVFSIVATCFMTSSAITTPIMSVVLVLVYYFIACDTPRGDRFAFKTMARGPVP